MGASPACASTRSASRTVPTWVCGARGSEWEWGLCRTRGSGLVVPEHICTVLKQTNKQNIFIPLEIAMPRSPA